MLRQGYGDLERLLAELGVSDERAEPTCDGYPLQPTSDEEVSDANA